LVNFVSLNYTEKKIDAALSELGYIKLELSSHFYAGAKICQRILHYL